MGVVCSLLFCAAKTDVQELLEYLWTDLGDEGG